MAKTLESSAVTGENGTQLAPAKFWRSAASGMEKGMQAVTISCSRTGFTSAYWLLGDGVKRIDCVKRSLVATEPQYRKE